LRRLQSAGCAAGQSGRGDGPYKEFGVGALNEHADWDAGSYHGMIVV